MTLKQKTLRQLTLTAAHNSFSKGLNTHANFRVHDSQMGEDLVQDTFIKTWKYMVKGGKIDSMKAFLYHVLNYLIIDEYRKHKTSSLETLAENGFDPGSDESLQLFDFIDGKKAALFVKLLPLTYRKVMHMRFIQDLSLNEISTITGQTRNATSVKVHRGLERLRVLYTRNNLNSKPK